MNYEVGTGDIAMIRYDIRVQVRDSEREVSLNKGAVVRVMGCLQERDWADYWVVLYPVDFRMVCLKVHQNYMRPLRPLELLALQALE
jgi:hypothetical protein